MNLQTFVSHGLEYQLSSVRADEELVRDIQRNLNRLGFNAGAIDGVWGAKTQAAFDRFKATRRITAQTFTPSIARLLLQPVPVGVSTNGKRPAPPPPPPARQPAPMLQRPVPGSAQQTAPAPTATTTQSGRRINAEALHLIKNFEGLRLEAYICPAGVPTIGYGSTAGVKLGQKITPQQAEALLIRDLARFETAVSNAVKVALNDNQFGALVAFTFNVGAGAFRESTLLKLLNQGNYQGAADQLLRWDKAGGRVLVGLQRRRQAERALFLKK